MTGFDKQFVMFDVTPVENQFLVDYLPGAPGDYVKVYLYGLMQCYHPQEDMTPGQMAKELELTEEEVMKAFRYWERRRLVERISDQPPTWRYVSPRQLAVSRDTDPQPDDAYVDFCEAMHGLFENKRKLTGRELATAWEWVTDMGLPVEVVLMLVQHMVSERGQNFTFKSAEKKAAELSDNHIATVEDAEVWLSRDKREWDGARDVLRRFSKHRLPTEDELAMYRVWTGEWGFAPEAILRACAETTGGDPSFKYLNGILDGMRRRNGGQGIASGQAMQEVLNGENDRAEPLRELLQTMNIRGATVNEGTLGLYDDMRNLYSREIILRAGRECARHNRSGLDQVLSLLQAWHEKGLATAEDVDRYIAGFDAQTQAIGRLCECWGIPARASRRERELYASWREQLGFSDEMILFCAAYADRAGDPMRYLDKLLRDDAAAGITTPQAAAQAHQSRGIRPEKERVKQVAEQLYPQRTYTEQTGRPAWLQALIEEDEHAQ